MPPKPEEETGAAGQNGALALTLFVAGVLADDADDAGALDDPAIVAYTFD